MGFLTSMDIAGSALTAQRLRMDVITQNITNATTTRTESGGPYVRQQVVFEERINGTMFNDMLREALNPSNLQQTAYGGVRVQQIMDDTTSEFTPVYNPSHPDANEEGYVMMPNVNTSMEMIDLMDATRAYEANLVSIDAVKSMATKALNIGR